MERLNLSVPPGEEWSLVVRATIGAIGVTAKLSLDTIDDLRSAVEEAFQLITHQERDVIRVTMTARVEAPFLHLDLSAQRAEGSAACALADPEIARLIIGALVTEVTLEGDQCGIHTVRMSVPIGAFNDERG
ncbi:MAG TPA: hypothetical protein VLA21_07000 [Candidatus Limnocylindria bacterium]|nr:hypothetical protein [Candidatus Limnocylindria bacterium]